MWKGRALSQVEAFSSPSLDNVEEHSLSPFIRECIVRVVRVEGCVRGSWGVSASSGKERTEKREKRKSHGRGRERSFVRRYI
jgi:hypothetical protein